MFLKLHALSGRKPDGDCLFADFSATYFQGLHGIIGPNGAGKTTFLRMIAGEVLPTSGHISRPDSIGFYSQILPSQKTLAELFGFARQFLLMEKANQGTATLQELSEIDWLTPQIFETAMQDAGLNNISHTRTLQSLSGGEQVKVQLAALFLRQPVLLLLDEPGNNLDTSGKDYLLSKLHMSRSIVLMTSHDRQLLDRVQTVTEIRGSKARFFPLSFSDVCLEQNRERKQAEKALTQSEHALELAKQENRRAEERQKKRNKQGKAARTNAGVPKMALDRAKGRAEHSTGKINRRINARFEQHVEAHDKARQHLNRILPLNFHLPASGVAPGKTILRAKSLSGGTNNIIEHFNLIITGPERIALLGDNGAGKTTLLSLLSKKELPSSGSVELFVRCAMLDQHVSLLNGKTTILENFRRLNPTENDNACYAALARLGFRNKAAELIVADLSGGEKIRAGLACTLASPSPVGLLILDEPTNHLDLDAINALETGLISYDGALIAVSHDQAFLEKININRTLMLPQHGP